MLQTLAILPGEFWVVALLIVLGVAWAVGKIREGIGIPMLAVLGTVAAWYVGDAFYNDYAGNYVTTFSADVLKDAWRQVALFLGAFLIATPFINHFINRRHQANRSQSELILRTERMPEGLESGLHQLFQTCVIVWLILAVIAAIRLQGNVIFYFFPFMGEKLDPWGRGQIGGGFSAVLSLAAFLQAFIAAALGVVAALVRNGSIRITALLLCAIVWPFYIFDRTRNSMLIVILPGLLAWVFLRLRGSILLRVGVLAVCFMAFSFWFKVIMANREGMQIKLSSENIAKAASAKEVHQAGLNMFEELCWVNSFIKDGTFNPPWGQEYFAELANPVPRGLWHNKPLIGLDYAVARGQLYTEEGTTATVSTGMIGQGVINFGRMLGPAFAALLMSCWAAVLARLDLRGKEPGNLALYALGLVLTFNMGRDISFITLYTFIFGGIVVWWLHRRAQNVAGRRRSKPASQRRREAGQRNPGAVEVPQSADR